MTTTPAPDQLVIAIDGPSGSGKSSVSRAVARALGVGFLDTGSMYRALTWWCLEQGTDLSDVAAVAQASRDLPLQIGTDPDAPTTAVGGHNVDAAIRESRISEAVSQVATNLDVRADMLQRQRALIADTAARTGGVVAEGRDITTVVAPDADVRVLLTASEEARLARRSKELHGDAGSASVEATRAQVVQRDARDSTVSQFTVAADGVTTVDTSDLDFDQSVAAVLDVVAARGERV
ncbi:(d)CMP kinase [Luteipulveratus halotolerans]|uniref:Cytidylate kinase n=1 Tax=Luteipulveratus halotolerans TaxID=1631356 RepID=A0A0L6CP45_9MICO|nr:(d)CMP kinase [Luteipulveratus halotolerans]KNX39308.1 cytidylate kinase [Luteipulveratus halotolerans]